MNPKQKVTMFSVLAFRYGTHENVFPIGIFTDRSKAEEAAKFHYQYRGGKYWHRIYEFTVNRVEDEVGHRRNTLPCVEVNAENDK